MALFDAFLKLDGIKGESADHKHKGDIDVTLFRFAVNQKGTAATGVGLGAGKAEFDDFEFTKLTDAASPLLMLHCANGKHIKEATFVVRKAGGEQLEYLKIKLTDVLVSSFKPGAVRSGPGDEGPEERKTGLGGGSVLPSETVSLNFAKIEYQYQPQGADGKAQGGPVMAGWDVKANQKV